MLSESQAQCKVTSKVKYWTASPTYWNYDLAILVLVLCLRYQTQEEAARDNNSLPALQNANLNNHPLTDDGTQIPMPKPNIDFKCHSIARTSLSLANKQHYQQAIAQYGPHPQTHIQRLCKAHVLPSRRVKMRPRIRSVFLPAAAAEASSHEAIPRP